MKIVNNKTINSHHFFQYNPASESIAQIIAEAETTALQIFQEAATRVPAYRDFLAQYSIEPHRIKTIADFQSLPFTSKENYILRYPLAARCLDGKITEADTVATSSGSSGNPLFWPRQLAQEWEGAQIHTHLFNQIFETDQKSTLFINAFAIGNWIAGMFTHASLYLSKLNGLKIMISSPGFNQDEVFKIMSEFSPHFDQTIIACHPPVLKMMMENAITQGLEIQKYNLKFLGAGEGFSENWRAHLLSLVNQSDQLMSMINIYGSADAGLIGFETPLSIHLHQLTSLEHKLNQFLFQSERNPYLYQYDPRMRFLESINGEIAITMRGVMPLIKYNIGDKGGLITPTDLNTRITEYYRPEKSLPPEFTQHSKQWNLPFVYIFGRDLFTVTLLGVNIYPETIKAAIEHADLQPYLTGRFSVAKITDDNQDQSLLIRLELKPKKKVSAKLRKLTQQIFVSTLKNLNAEYNQIELRFGNKVHPVFKYHRYNHPRFFPEGKIKKGG